MKGLLFTYALTYGGSVVSLFNPWVGLLIYICFAIIKPESLWYWSVPVANYSRIVAIALLIGWAHNGFGNWNLGRARGIILALVGFWFWGTLSGMIAAADTSKGWEFSEAIAKVLLPVLVGITTIDSIQRLKVTAWVIVLSQGFVAFEANLSYLEGFNKMALLGMSVGDNNTSAIAMVTGTGLAFFMGLDAPRTWQKFLALGCALLMGHAVLLSFSRGAMLALGASGLVSFLLLPKRFKHYLAFALAVAIALRLAGPQVRQEFATSFVEKHERDESAQSRLDLWADSWDTMMSHPLLGVGPYHWRLIAHQYGWPVGKSAHSAWFEIGAELGVPGLAFLVLVFGQCITRLWPLTRSRDDALDPEIQQTARMVIASLVGFVVAISFVTSWGLEIGYYVALVGAAGLKLCPLSPAATVADPAIS